MTEIPDDVMKAAWRVAIDDLCIDEPGQKQVDVVKVIARAIMAERERCHASWLPINTAPKDGSKFLFLEKSRRVQVGRYDTQFGETPAIYVCLSNYGSDFYPAINPEYWMNLPKLPVDM